MMEESSLIVSLRGEKAWLPPFKCCYSYLNADGTLGRTVNHWALTARLLEGRVAGQDRQIPLRIRAHVDFKTSDCS